MALDDSHARPSGPPRAGGPGERATPLADDEVLACGRLLSQVWEQARDQVRDQARDAPSAPDPHTLSCPQCSEALAALAALGAAARMLCAMEPPSPRTLTDRVMNSVRGEPRFGRLLPLAGRDRNLRITESAAAKALRQAADTIPGARAGICRLAPADQGAGVGVTMTLAAALDRPLPERADRVRHSVFTAAGRALGMAVTTVDIIVVDIIAPPPPLARPRPPSHG
ncbi:MULTISPECIES: hypothetical protein [unclassified Streptomyces]|uniref:hypothetical protein n=1 Tax=unclassified Streptomyces TaxID=2593676 RepID=UPI00036E45FF|nr:MULTISPECIES: hypothetical protein [unclassified Streptomyces]MYX25678.1 hypothetical protein [Streptomyces sp. SID8381]